MRPRGGIDQLRGNANAVPDQPHAALQHVAHAELAPDLTDIDSLALVLEAGVASDDEQLAEARQLGNNIFHNAVGQILLLRIAA
jgi:hypothetical protein